LTEFVAGNVFIRTNGNLQGVDPGAVIPGHKHHFDHVAIFFNGRWRATRGDETIERDGPFFLLIDKDQFHRFEYLASNKERGISWCVFAHRNPQGEVVEEYDGWRPAHELRERADA
jgi:hypothetical protein